MSSGLALGLSLAAGGQALVALRGWFRAQDWWSRRLARADRRDQEMEELDRLYRALMDLRTGIPSDHHDVADDYTARPFHVALQSVADQIDVAENLLLVEDKDLTEEMLDVVMTVRIQAEDEVDALAQVVVDMKRPPLPGASRPQAAQPWYSAVNTRTSEELYKPRPNPDQASEELLRESRNVDERSRE